MRYTKIIDIISDLYIESSTIHNRTVGFLQRLKNIVYFDKAAIVFFYKERNSTYSIKHTISIDLNVDYYSFPDGPLKTFEQDTPIVFKMSIFYNPESLKTSNYWNNYLRPNNCIYALEGNLQIDDKYGLMAGFSLYRMGDKHDFTEEDIEVMELLQPHLSNSLKEYNATLGAMKIISTFENFKSVGIAIINEKYEISSKGDVFKELTQTKYRHLSIIRKVKELCIEMNSNDYSSIEYKSEMAPLHIEIAKVPPGTYPQIKGEAYTCLIYDLSFFMNFTLEKAKSLYSLTDREYDIVQLVMRGKSGEEIAEDLYLSIPTIKKHLASIYSKMGIKNQKQIFDKLKIF